MSEEKQRGEELFETLSRNKKQRRRKLIRNVLIVLAVVAVVLVGTVLKLRSDVRARFASDAANVLSHQVAAGTIHTTVSGSGVLEETDKEQIVLPATVKITELYVQAGDAVQTGDLLAAVDMATVMTALSDLQQQLNDLDGDIRSAKGETVSSQISARISGRVKQIFAEPGMDVTSCMARNGALAVLSLDGKMAVDLETEALGKGQTVSVTRADGTVLEGEVEAAAGGRATVLVTDNGPRLDEEVSVTAQDGTNVGKGKLYIHNPLAVTGYAGTVSNVSVKENSYIYANSTMFTLKNTSFSANYDTLLRQRGELEEQLLELLTIYRDGAVLSYIDGRISSVEYDEETETSIYVTEEGNGLLTLSPNTGMSITIGVDETDILALEEGQEAQVEVSSVSEELFNGTVTEISKVADTSTGVTRYSAEVTLDREEGMLPGMTAEVDVKIQGVENALIIPVEALHQTSTIYYVYTSYDAKTQQYGGMTEVTPGMQNDTQVEILSGLQLGDTVYYTEKNDFFAMIGAMMGMGGGNSSRSAGNARPAGQMPSGGMPAGRNMGG